MLSLLQSLNMILIAVTPKKSLDESLEEVVLTDASHKLVISLLAMLVITVHITWIPNRNARPTNRSTSNLNFVAREQRSFVRSPRWSARVPVVARNALSSSILRFTGLSADPGQLRSSKSSMNTRSCSNPWHDVKLLVGSQQNAQQQWHQTVMLNQLLLPQRSASYLLPIKPDSSNAVHHSSWNTTQQSVSEAMDG